MKVGRWLAVAAGYAAGALPFAAWVARARGGDVRKVGDGNPGAFNAWAVGGPAAGVAAAVGDWAKGALSVALALRAGTRGPSLVLAALAPVAGHRTSPLLGGRGGKGLATTFGVWTALGGPAAPVAFGGVLGAGVGLLRLREGWAIALGLPALLISLRTRPSRRGTAAAAWLLNGGWLLWAYRDRFGWPPQRPRGDGR